MKGNKDEKFVEERRALLERFLREIAQYDYLIESKEFKVFARGTGEVTNELEKMPPQSPIQILEKYRLNFKIDEDQANSETARYKDKINIFQAFLRKAIVSLEVSLHILQFAVNLSDETTLIRRVRYFSVSCFNLSI